MGLFPRFVDVQQNLGRGRDWMGFGRIGSEAGEMRGEEEDWVG